MLSRIFDSFGYLVLFQGERMLQNHFYRRAYIEKKVASVKNEGK